MTGQLQRGDFVTIADAQGHAGGGSFSGKPRPALVVQADLFNETHASVTVCLVTSMLVDAPLFRIAVSPSDANGLRKPSQIMADKLASVRVDALGQRLGKADLATLQAVDRALKLWLGL